VKYEKLSKNFKQIEKILTKDNVKNIETCAILVSANNKVYSSESSSSFDSLILCINFLSIRYKIADHTIHKILGILDREIAGNILLNLGARNE